MRFLHAGLRGVAGRAVHATGRSNPARREIADALSGNLCRCTGYRPILDAGEAMYAAPRRRVGDGRRWAALKALQ
jgi:xanthine dehydrogenase small subunit